MLIQKPGSPCSSSLVGVQVPMCISLISRFRNVEYPEWKGRTKIESSMCDMDWFFGGRLTEYSELEGTCQDH